MFQWLRPRKGIAEAPTPDSNQAPVGWLRPQSATELLAIPHRQALIEQIWQRTAVSPAQFTLLYQTPLERYAELVQLLPASESHHHAYPGGLLDHGLEIVICALKLRQSHLLPPGSSPEIQTQQAEAWTAGIAYAALLHDIGKLVTDVDVEDQSGQRWHPWHGPLRYPYRFRHKPYRQYRLHGVSSGLLAAQVLGREPMDWLCEYPELWAALLHALAGQHEQAGILGDIVVRADQASVAHALGGDPSLALAAPRHALQRKLLDGLRYLAHEVLKLNQPEASDGWLTDNALWLVSKTASDKLRAHLLSQGISGIPERNTTLFNILQEYCLVLENAEGKAIWRATVQSESGWAQSFTLLKLAPSLIWQSENRPTPFAGTVVVEIEVLAEEATDEAPPSEKEHDSTPLGLRFMDWLQQHLQNRTLRINETKALVHTVDNTLFLVTPGLFQRYAQEHPDLVQSAKQEQLEDWELVQKSFERLKKHRKQPNDLNIWTCIVHGPRKSSRLYGYLLAHTWELPEELKLNNPYLQLITDESV